LKEEERGTIMLQANEQDEPACTPNKRISNPKQFQVWKSWNWKTIWRQISKQDDWGDFTETRFSQRKVILELIG
jgi:hypothetical protein